MQLLTAAMVSVVAGAVSHAEVVRLEIKSVEPAFDGQSFGDTGTYERIRAVAHHRLDPTLPVNAGIVNIGLAPREADGRIAFDADVEILVPADRRKANGRMVYELVNRGRSLMLASLNDATRDSPAGNGFLMNQGYALVMSGWQVSYPIAGVVPMSLGLASRFPDAESSGLLYARLPTARNADGTPITGMTREQFSDMGPAKTFIAHLTYPAATLKQKTHLQVRNLELDAATTPTGLKWKLLDEWRVEVQQAPVTPDGAIYEFSYVARDPIVYGLALASMRDLVAFLRHDTSGANPLASPGGAGVTHTIGLGASQTGRTLKELVYEFNDDEQGRKVLDGAFIMISGAGKNAVNSQFARPGVKEAHHGYRGVRGDEFPFSYPLTYDPLSRQWGGVVARCQGLHDCPKIIHLDSENELWHGGALTFVDAVGNDMAMPDNVRVYAVAGSEHSSRPSGRTPPICKIEASSGINWAPFARALFTALDRWVTSDTVPPTSRYPTRVAGQLVPPDEYAFPVLPAVHFYGAVGRRYLWDRSSEPPAKLADYPVFVPQSDRDGNMLGGLRHPFMDVPLATNTGWNPRKAGMGEGDICIASGMQLPFAATRQARLANGDPRPSVAERYLSVQDYLDRVQLRIDQLATQGYLLEQDKAAIIEAAQDAIDSYSAAWN
ncbi:MAG: hypothetical protein H6978_06410 [Gammaproteobacteria bacterium]|nr:hypothetical protein [Gammaproteobacteria bacterium]